MRDLGDRPSWVPVPPPTGREAWLVAFRFRDLTTTMASAVTALRAARVALRRESGLPDADAAAEDPFTGSMLRQVADAEGYVIYGVGPNGMDDGGMVTPVAEKWEAPGSGNPRDVGVRVRYRRAASISPSNSGLNSPVR
jgi:hypothetical protein